MVVHDVTQDNVSDSENASPQKLLVQERWKEATKSVNKATVASRKVPLENKIGTKADELDEDDPLKVIALSVQRSLRDFGKSTKNTDGKRFRGKRNRGREGKLVTKDTLKYVVDEGETTYTVPQPQYECERILDEEFKRIRTAFGVTDREYFSSLGLQEKRTQSDLYVISSKDASGKSSSFFFLTPGQRYILKLCTANDVDSIRNILTRYRAHIESSCRNNGEDGEKTISTSLLPRVYGLYSLRFADPSIPDVVLLAQANFFAAAHKIHKKFDLKGSTHDRFASEREREKDSPVFKDLDWVEQGHRLRFTSKKEMNDVRDQLQRDTEFLSSCDLIDYSLLVGVHEMDKSMLHCYERNSEPFRVVHTRSRGDHNICYFGIVDVLTPYGTEKALETLLTGTLMCCRDISCQAPDIYHHRFMQFCKDQILDYDESSTDSLTPSLFPAMGSSDKVIFNRSLNDTDEMRQSADSSLMDKLEPNVIEADGVDQHDSSFAECCSSDCNSEDELDYLLNHKFGPMQEINLDDEISEYLKRVTDLKDAGKFPAAFNNKEF